MTGNNEFRINGATMREIVQHYFDTVMFKVEHSPTVDSIYHDNSGMVFVVKTKEPESKK